MATRGSASSVTHIGLPRTGGVLGRMLRRGSSLLLSRRGPLCAPVRRRLCDKSPSSPIELDLVRRAKDLGLPPLSLSERSLIAREADALGDADGRLSESDWALLVSRRARAEQERLTISEYLAKSHDQHLGQHGLKLLSRMGITFFALCGGHTAGEAGMHWAGATVVGCVTGLGGGTINNVMMGSTPVGWMRDPPILLSAVAAALAGFYLWPLAERFFEADGATDTTGAAGKSAASTSAIPRSSGVGYLYSKEYSSWSRRHISLTGRATLLMCCTLQIHCWLEKNLNMKTGVWPAEHDNH